MGQLFKTFEYGTKPNHYDWLKALALVTMIIDHVGNYFFPEMEWFRVVGRIAFPIFLFLVGFSGSYKFNKYLCAGAVIVSLSAFWTAHPVFPLNILWAILLTRIILQRIENSRTVQRELPVLWFGLLMFYIPIGYLVEYGSLSLMFGLLGVIARQGRTDISARLFWGLTALTHIAAQATGFGFSPIQVIVMSGEIGFLMALFLHFRMAPKPELATAEPSRRRHFYDKTVILIARNTLALYVLHVVLFQIVARLFFPEISAGT